MPSVFPELTALRNEVNLLIGESFDLAATHSDVQAAVVKWQACMAEDGFDLASRAEAFNFALELRVDEADGDTATAALMDPTEAELVLAARDGFCTEQHDYLTTISIARNSAEAFVAQDGRLAGLNQTWIGMQPRLHGALVEALGERAVDVGLADG